MRFVEDDVLARDNWKWKHDWEKNITTSGSITMNIDTNTNKSFTLHKTIVIEEWFTYFDGKDVWELTDYPDISEEELYLNIQEQLM